MCNNNMCSGWDVSHGTGSVSLMNMAGKNYMNEWIDANDLRQHHMETHTSKWILKRMNNWKCKAREQSAKKGKKYLTLTNDNCCIPLLWGSVCRQQGSWDRWRPIWANPQTKRGINQSLCVFMGMGCDVSVSISLSLCHRENNLTNPQSHETQELSMQPHGLREGLTSGEWETKSMLERLRATIELHIHLGLEEYSNTSVSHIVLQHSNMPASAETT